MEIINRQKIAELSREYGEALVSIYLPTHRVGKEMQQDPIRFKNLITEAQDRLVFLGLRKPDIDKLLEPAYKLQLDSDFWQHQSDGLVLFLAFNFFRYYRLPISFETLLVVADRFHLKPLIPLLSKNGHFFVLALSQKNIRLLEGSLFNIDELDLDDVPSSLRAALWFDDPEKQLQYHTGSISPRGVGARPAIFHGQGVNEQDNKIDLLRYFQHVDKGLMETLGDEESPLILAGVDYLLPIYQQANSYPYLVEQAIEGNPDERSAEDLHQDALRIVKPIFDADQQQAIERYSELSGSGSELASDHLASIIPAAHNGRVETLFVRLGEQRWGRFDDRKNLLEQHAESVPGDQDLLDLVAIQTLSNGGNVFALELEGMPAESPIAAVFRYPL